MLLWRAEPISLLRASRQFEERVGFTAQELGATPLLEWLHPEDLAGLQQRLEEETGSVQARHRTGDGGWVELDWEVRRGPDGVAVLGQVREESGEAESPGEPPPAAPGTSLAQTLEAMVRVVEANNAPKRCSILLVDAEHEHVTVGAGPSLPAEYNAAVEGLRIGPAVGSCGTAAFWNIPVVVEDIARDPLWKDLRGAAALAGVSSCWSHPITAADNRVLGAMALYDTRPCVPTRSELGGLEIAARMVGLEIERHRLEEQVLQAAKLEALGVLAGGIAHDFNNMLAAILGNAELAMNTLSKDAEALPMLRRIVAASVGATDFCNQMLAYAGRGALSREVFEFSELLVETSDLLRVALSKKATLVLDLDQTAMFVSADSSQVRQVIMNLITNAAEAVGDTEGRVVVSTQPAYHSALQSCDSTLPPGEYLCLKVTDSGVGMSPRVQAKVFDPFFTTKSAGRGLGLAAVQGIVLGHGGSIHVASRPGAGTTVTVELPRVPAPDVSIPVEASGVGAPPPKRILLAEDDSMVHDMMTQMLEGAGHIVLGARDGQEAVDLYRRESASIDLVLLDLSMPKLDGEQVYRELIQIRPDVRVILSSGFTEQEIKARLRGADLAGILQKPTQMRVLLAKVAGVLSPAQAPTSPLAE